MSKENKQEDNFQVLQLNQGSQKQHESTKSQVTEAPSKIIDVRQTSAQQQQKRSDSIPNQILQVEKQQDSINLCMKCTRCLQLQEQLRKNDSEKETMQQNLVQLTIQVQQLKRQQSRIHQQKVDKTELNFCVQSLKQMIKSFEQQDSRIKKFLSQTLKLNINPQKSTYSLIQSILTDYHSNWQQLDRDLSSLTVLSSPTGEGTFPKQDSTSSYTYNYYETSAKVQKIRQNIVQLQKMLR